MNRFVVFLIFIGIVHTGLTSPEIIRDTPCDTIKLTDGRIILGRIYYEDRTVVRYHHCNEAIKTKDEIPMFQVREIAYGSDTHNQPMVEDRSRLNNRGVYLIISITAVLIAAVLVAIFLL